MSELNNTSNLLVEPIVNHSAEIIKVIGVGGGGGNAVGQMYREGIEGVRFLVCNTDQKALEDSVVPDKIQLGPGLGAGGQPVVGQDLAEKNLDKIDAIFDDKVKWCSSPPVWAVALALVPHQSLPARQGLMVC